MPVSLGGLEDKRRYCVKECSDCCTAWVKERSSACRAGRGRLGLLGARCRKGSLTGWPLEPGPPRGLEMALLSSPRPHCDVSLGKGPEIGLVQVRIMEEKGGGLCSPWSNRALKGSVAGLQDVEITLFP